MAPQRMQQQQIVRRIPQRPPQQQMARYAPPPQYAPSVARRGNQRVYSGRVGPPQQQMARRGQPQEYEGAVQHLGTTDRLVTQAAQPRSAAVARRSQPTLADPEGDQYQDSAPPQVRQTSRRQYAQ